MKALLKTALCAAYKYGGVARLHDGLDRLRGRADAVILLFHRVTDAIAEDGLTVSTARFRRICRMLRHSFRVVPLAEVFRLARAGGPLPQRTVAVTFDDCYKDNLDAARVLAEHGLPATFFVPAGFVGTEHTFPWDGHLPALPNLTWDEVRTMAGLGCEIGSHGLTHADFGTLPVEEARRDLVESRRLIEAQVGRRVRWFAYPFGEPENFRDELLPVVAEAGYEGCVSSHGGVVAPGMTGLMLPREPASYFKSVLNLELYLRGSLRWFYDLKRRLNPARAAAARRGGLGRAARDNGLSRPGPATPAAVPAPHAGPGRS
jgi:peptidoglycan/xylan/chitin deacetylase (PgdA/CDA1 family)